MKLIFFLFLFFIPTNLDIMFVNAENLDEINTYIGLVEVPKNKFMKTSPDYSIVLITTILKKIYIGPPKTIMNYMYMSILKDLSYLLI
ncbi:hypothetical protein KUTeg_003186 [Tegillarca granosa]|uniref:Uncharacterized protein n=1 Tax=Tegillarca granosa TaxID=220873 RepID=A0ABQ9FLE6_TEGGR|nr:hypothetical protein KUTeg_003186 [Tegillarca granosa]